MNQVQLRLNFYRMGHVLLIYLQAITFFVDNIDINTIIRHLLYTKETFSFPIPMCKPYKRQVVNYLNMASS
jgi:hypothetical protein